MEEKINSLVNNEIEKLELDRGCNFSRIIEPLKINTSLGELKLYNLYGVEKETIEIIKLLPSKEFLTVLECNFNTFEPEQLLEISKVVIEILSSSKSLKKLILGWGETFSENDGINEIFKSLKYNTSLESLRCSFSTNTNSKTYEVIAEMLSSNMCLKNLILLHYNGMDMGVQNAIAFAKSLNENNTLEKLLLIDTNFENTEIAIIFESLKYNTTLKELGINENHFSISPNDSIYGLLIRNKFLRVLNLESTGIKSDDAILIAKALEQNKSLQVLDLSSNNVESDGAIALFQSLNANSTLQVLKLSGNLIRYIAANSKDGILKTNTSLTELDLSHNDLGASETDVVADLLLKNKTLLKLYLSTNNLGSEWAIKISEALLLNDSLRELNVSRNSIGSGGLIAIAKMLIINKSLQTLILGDGNLDCTNSATEIFKAMSINESLKSLNFISYKINVNKILPFLEENYTLTHLHIPYFTSKIRDIIERNKNLLNESLYKKTKAVHY